MTHRYGMVWSDFTLLASVSTDPFEAKEFWRAAKGEMVALSPRVPPLALSGLPRTCGRLADDGAPPEAA